MKFDLIKLPYDIATLSPVISPQTVDFHHGKHLKAYVDNLNKLVAGTEFEDMPLQAIVAKSEGALFNNAGQVLNHNLYFTQFSPTPKVSPEGELSEAIRKNWGDLDNFKKEFEAAGVTIFGSGWAWLVKDKDGKLGIVKEFNGSNPVVHGLKPLLGFDVWEHAYYLDYQNRRADHLHALWNIVDWKIVERRFEKHIGDFGE
jgi:Fe-Mn family superoxide dismutase